ncbi:MAG: AAA family ATPase [Bacteroidales bacterium]|nr:AAA family ATPase [Bacteroidales bacterium]MCF8455269.1 AAA family ATPase [Bacteroidales bacterium]
MLEIIGRNNEVNALNSIYQSSKSEFVALYGRRRVGKTFLINTVFEGKFTFKMTGMANSTLGQQLMNFHLELQKADPLSEEKKANNWQLAFHQLIVFLEQSKEKRKVVFIDELPWFDTPKSGFVQAFEHFWNNWASAQNDVVLIVCGSATSWMVNRLINDKGGLHNRLTKRIKLLPFTLGECEKFLQTRNSVLDRYQIVQLYMAFGGIPFYWDQVEKGYSATQNIDRICFDETGLLRNEFTNLYRSLFKNYHKYETIVKALAKKSMGLTRDEIIYQTKLPNAGSTTRLLNELEENGFIRKYIPWGKKRKNGIYQLVDFYSHFYLKFIADTQPMDENSWINTIDSPSHRAWSGYAFEQVCMYHLPQIKQALGIAGVQTTVSSWRSKDIEQGAQVDLVIDRRDQIINLCEIKYSVSPFAIDKNYDAVLRNKLGTFRRETNTQKSIFLTMITTFGLKQNIYSTGVIQNNIKMDELFHP